MSRSRRYFDPNDARSQHGPSDEMLAVDAATEVRSLTLLYERYADRLFRYFLLCTGDRVAAERLLRDLIIQLPNDLQRYAGQEKSFAGWLFGRASEVFWQEYSMARRFYRRLSRFLPNRTPDDHEGAIRGSVSAPPVLSDFDEIAAGLKQITPDRREVLAINIGAGLKTAAAAEALKLPASLISSHVQWALDALAEQLEVSNTRRLNEDFSNLVHQQSLRSEQRQSHFALIHGIFYGEVTPDSDEEEDRAPVFEIAALVGVVVIGLIGIWVWGLITPGDQRVHQVDSPPIAAERADDDAAEDEPESTPTADVDDPLDSTADNAQTNSNGVCMAQDGKAEFDRFINRFNEGNFDRLGSMLMPPGLQDSEDPTSEDAATPPDYAFIHGTERFDSPDDFLAYLEERYEAGERWDALEAYPAEQYRNWHAAEAIEQHRDWKAENPGLSMIIVAGLDWSGDDAAPELATGRIVIDCVESRVVEWDLQVYGTGASVPVSIVDYLVLEWEIEGSNGQPHVVSVEDYQAAMQPLEPGEQRTLEALVRTDGRPDGGSVLAWKIQWTEGVLDTGRPVERIEVRSLDGSAVISFIDYDTRWWLDQRGWQMYGRFDNPPMPDEIALTTPWLRQLPEHLADIDPASNAQVSVSLSDDQDFTSAGGIERLLDVTVTDGALGAVEIRERTHDGERVGPRFNVLSVDRSSQIETSQFDIEFQPRYPELETATPRYLVPESDWEQLELIEVLVGDDQTQETYRIRWNDVLMDLTVRPSRGGLDPSSIPSGVDESWTTAVADYRWGRFVWAHRQFAGYPTDAIWDDGRYRFDISVDRDAVTNEEDWGLRQLTELTNALSVELNPADYPDEFENPAEDVGFGDPNKLHGLLRTGNERSR